MSDVQPIALSPSSATRDEQTRAELRSAAEAFEGLLLQSMLRSMREAQLDDGFFGTGAGASVYEAMFEQHMSDALANGSPLGVARELESRWSRSLSGLDEARSLMRTVDRHRADPAAGPVPGPERPGSSPTVPKMPTPAQAPAPTPQERAAEADE